MIYSSSDSPGLARVIAFLQSHSTEYLSGQDLSDVLKISRVAVWKHVKRLQDLGYVIESKQKSGYRLIRNSDALLPWEITSGLKTEIIGRRAVYYEETDSTQDRALEMARDPDSDGTVISAQRQTGGRGRSGRRWASPEGGIWLSVILHPRFGVSTATLFPIASSLALSKALEKTLGISPELKWPNDVTMGGKKLAGMLVDVSLESNRIESMVLGVGINFDADAAQIQRDLDGTPNFYGAASLGDVKGNVRPVELVQSFLAELEGVYELLGTGQTDRIVSEWTKRSSTIGRDVSLDTINGRVIGRAVRIDGDGALVVSDGKGASRVIAGDITHT